MLQVSSVSLEWCKFLQLILYFISCSEQKLLVNETLTLHHHMKQYHIPALNTLVFNFSYYKLGIQAPASAWLTALGALGKDTRHLWLLLSMPLTNVMIITASMQYYMQ